MILVIFSALFLKNEAVLYIYRIVKVFYYLHYYTVVVFLVRRDET
jgi:hypothetical protein